MVMPDVNVVVVCPVTGEARGRGSRPPWVGGTRHQVDAVTLALGHGQGLDVADVEASCSAWAARLMGWSENGE